MSENKSLQFRGRIKLYEANPYVVVSVARVEQLQKGWRKPLPVTVQINGQPTEPWHINMMPIGDGSFYLYLHGDVRKASRTKVGDMVTVNVAFDDSYSSGPAHSMLESFGEALEANQNAKAAWERLIPSRQKEVLRYMSGLKSSEAKQRNVERAMQVLSGHEARFMGRAWRDGS